MLGGRDAPHVLVMSYTALVFWVLDVLLMFAAFSALRKGVRGAVPGVLVVFLIHVGMALTTLINLEDNGCVVSLPVLTAEVAVVVGYVLTFVRIYMPPR
eukprot:scaffold48_cov311-Pinguiococcus_pyrenoidosus.AAC.20